MPTYDLQALGCVLDGNPANAAKNTTIFRQAIQSAKSNPGPIYLGMGNGLAVTNGQLNLDAPNMVLRGEAGMGTVSDWGPTSLIRGFGPGDTLKVTQGGCRISGLCWQGDSQGPADSFIKITQTQVEVFDCNMDSPNIGIKVLFPFMQAGQFWARNILMGGMIKVCGMDIGAGQAAVKLDHVRMFNGSMDPGSPQPPYGVLVKSAGEFMMLGSCDIDNCGINLAIVPGLTGVANEYVGNIVISDTDLDNGNSDQLLIRPLGSSFIGDVALSNVRSCSINNNAGAWPGNAFTLDGSMSRPNLNVSPIMNVSMVNCFGLNALRHCGLYAKSVVGLSVVGSTFGGNFNGIQTYGCTGTISGNKCGAYVFPPLGTVTSGNTAYGVLVEKSNMVFNPNDNSLSGNGVPPGWKVIP